MTVTYRVLVADDDPPSRELAANVLESFGCAVTLATDGQQALDFLLTEQFDVVFMDYHMPRLDGLSVVRTIREQEKSRGVQPLPIVALTASAMPAECQMCLDAGMNDVLIKPYRFAELQRLLERWGNGAAAGQRAR